jgi:alkyl hydroperoxide reductase subunit F
VIGGGNSGVEAAIDLAGIVAHVTLLEFDGKLRADAVLQKKLFSLPNVTVVTQALTTEVTGDGKKVNGLVYTDRTSGERTSVDSKASSCRSACCRTPTGSRHDRAERRAARSRSMRAAQTSLPGVFAAGDCTTVPYKQIIIAMGEGAKAALSAFDHLIRRSPEASPPAAGSPAAGPLPTRRCRPPASA